jgi:hypothetical protein
MVIGKVSTKRQASSSGFPSKIISSVIFWILSFSVFALTESNTRKEQTINK